MGSSKPKQEAYSGGITRIGGRDVATNTKEGNNIVTAYNPTAQEEQSYQYVQNQLPSIYQKALSNEDFSDYANDYKQNQLTDLNESYRQGLNTAKGALVSSGQSSSSQGLDQLQAFNKPYIQQQASINANAPIEAQQLRANDQSYNTSNLANAMNMINQYYNTGNTFMPTSASASKSGNDYNQQVYKNALAAQQAANQNTMGYAKLGTQLAGAALMFVPGGQAAGAALMGAGASGGASKLASDIKTKKNIVKLCNKNGINIYEFEYKTDKYPELPKGRQIGVIAQEVEHIPNAVIQGDKYKLVDYSVILPMIA